MCLNLFVWRFIHGTQEFLYVFVSEEGGWKGEELKIDSRKRKNINRSEICKSIRDSNVRFFSSSLFSRSTNWFKEKTYDSLFSTPPPPTHIHFVVKPFQCSSSSFMLSLWVHVQEHIDTHSGFIFNLWVHVQEHIVCPSTSLKVQKANGWLKCVSDLWTQAVSINEFEFSLSFFWTRFIKLYLGFVRCFGFHTQTRFQFSISILDFAILFKRKS